MTLPIQQVPIVDSGGYRTAVCDILHGKDNQ